MPCSGRPKPAVGSVRRNSVSPFDGLVCRRTIHRGVPSIDLLECVYGEHTMILTTNDDTEIYYKDWGQGQPVVFSHGWPLTADAWEDQMVFLANHGYRCIAHDRRSHGRS